MSNLSGWLEPVIVLVLSLVVLTLTSVSARAFSALGVARARYLVDEGHKKLEAFVASPDGYWMTLHLLDVLAIVGLFWSGYTILSFPEVGFHSWMKWLTIAVVYFIFHTAMGYRFSRGDEREIVPHLLVILKPFYLCLRPLVYAICRFLCPSVSSRDERYADAERIEEELEVMLDESTRRGGLENVKGRIMRSAMDYGETTVREVMIPRTKLTAISVETPIDEALKLCVHEGYSRLPVYDGNLDTIVGILYFKDLVEKFFELRKQDEARAGVSLKGLVREAFFVPETNHIDAVFEDFKREHIHMAIVVDEFGGTAGLVTLEDIMEEFFGDIQDEYDSEESAIIPIDDNSDEHVLVDARMNISEICERFNVEIEEDPDFESVGGLITTRLGHVGQIGEEIDEAGLHFLIRDANEKCILQVEISRLPKEETGEG